MKQLEWVHLQVQLTDLAANSTTHTDQPLQLGM